MATWVFPMAGYGKRTSSLGEYKPLIEVFEEKTVLDLCLTGLSELIDTKDKLVFITTQDFEESHSVATAVSNTLKRLNLKNSTTMVNLPYTPAGQALTLLNGIAGLEEGFLMQEVFVINPDQFVFFDLADVDRTKCSVGLYFNPKPSSCFYDIDIASKKVISMKEKQMISCYASAGIFFFTTGKVLVDCIQWGLKNNKQYNNELYLGPCMEYIKDVSYFKTILKFDLGNVTGIELFKKFGKKLFAKGESI